MTSEKREKHLEKAPHAGDQQVAGTPITTGSENATQQRIEKQTAARAYRFTKGDNAFKIDMGDGSTIQDSRPQVKDAAVKQLLAEDIGERRPALSGEISNGVEQVIATGHAVKFTTRPGGGIDFEPSGQWTAADWAKQMKTLKEYFTSHPQALNQLVTEAKQQKDGITISSHAETNEGNAPTSDHPHSENKVPADDKAQRTHEQNKTESVPLTGEVNNALTELIPPGRAVTFSLRADGGITWNFPGHWDLAESKAESKKLEAYLTAHPETFHALIAELKQSGTPLKLGIEASEPPPKPLPQTSGDVIEQKPWLVGEGSINGHPVLIGGPNDAKILADAGPNTPVTLSTTDGSGETIHGHIVVDRNGQRSFYPDYTEDDQHNKRKVPNPEQNTIKLNSAGTASYVPYQRQ